MEKVNSAKRRKTGGELPEYSSVSVSSDKKEPESGKDLEKILETNSIEPLDFP